MATGSPKRKRAYDLPLDTKGPVPRLLSEHDFDEIDHQDQDRHTDRQGVDRDASLQQGTQDSVRPDLEALSTRQEGVSRASEDKSHETSRHLESASRVPQAQGNTLLTESAQRLPRSKSPPLAGEISDHFWHDSEITGHDPNDPDDDMYGINGIGFRPTAALAWSRSQRRKQQLTEYKNREARDARQQRSERRKRFISDNDDTPSRDSSPRKSVRVRFEDG